MKGVPLKTVQEILGHKSFLTTLRYAHLAPELRMEAVERISEIGRGHILVTKPGSEEGVAPLSVVNGWEQGGNGAPRGTRTHDPLIKNQLLYQLSYRRPMCRPFGTGHYRPVALHFKSFPGDRKIS